MKKVIFIDRDGTIINEPPVTFQVDTLEQLRFLPGAIRNLYQIANEMDYELVMVSNQDGLGTPGYPESNFDSVQSKMLEILGGEGIRFEKIFIDRSFPEEGLNTRKPGTGMLQEYIYGPYDLKRSFVIGDRLTDVQLAKNLGAGSIFIQNNESNVSLQEEITLVVKSWDEITAFLRGQYRRCTYERITKETSVKIELNLDGTGQYEVNTGLGFFDHMLEQLARHSGIDLALLCVGDLKVDEHHTIEDTGIALGAAFSKAFGAKKNLERYGFSLPMDDCLSQVALDFGGRSWLVWDADFKRERIGDVPCEMFQHFFKSFCDGAAANLNIKAEGTNEHHKIESIFKAVARSVKAAIRTDPRNSTLPTTKGVL
jgi:imidazoleglycerol-phosphate dehydratase/histidinol-phosphatase